MSKPGGRCVRHTGGAELDHPKREAVDEGRRRVGTNPARCGGGREDRPDVDGGVRSPVAVKSARRKKGNNEMHLCGFRQRGRKRVSVRLTVGPVTVGDVQFRRLVPLDSSFLFHCGGRGGFDFELPLPSGEFAQRGAAFEVLRCLPGNHTNPDGSIWSVTVSPTW